MEKFKYILLCAILLCTITTFAQPAQYTPMTAAGYQMKRLKVDSTLHLPSFCGVPTILGSTAKEGALAIDTCGALLYMWTRAGGWDTVNTSGGLNTIPTLQQVTTAGATTTNGISVPSINIGNTGSALSVTTSPESLTITTPTSDELLIVKNNLGAGIKFGGAGQSLELLTYNGGNVSLQTPSTSGTIPISVNGYTANLDGNITIPAGGNDTTKVPYTGANKDVNIGTHDLFTNKVYLYDESNDNYGSIHYTDGDFHVEDADNHKLLVIEDGFMQLHLNDTIQSNIFTTSLTQVRNHTLPDKSGTFALTSDTVSLSNRINLKLNTADTSTLSNRINLKLNTADTSTLSNRINLKLNVTDTASLSNRINLKLNIADTSTLSNRINLKLNIADTSTLSNRINLKLNVTDTASLSNRINLKLNIADTSTLSNRINLKLNIADTSTLSNRINLKLNASDTASLSNRINLKLNISDTSAMLLKYLRKTDTATLSSRIDLRVRYSDTASMLSNYQTAINNKVNLSDVNQTIAAFQYLGSSIKFFPIGVNSFIQATTNLQFINTRIFLTAIYVPTTTTVTGVKWITGSAGTSYVGGANYNGIALYSYNVGTGLCTRIDSTASDANTWATAGFQSKAFVTTASLSQGVYFLAAICNGSATTFPSIVQTAAQSVVTTYDFTSPAKLTGNSTGTVSPASFNLSTITNTTNTPVIALY